MMIYPDVLQLSVWMVLFIWLGPTHSKSSSRLSENCNMSQISLLQKGILSLLTGKVKILLLWVGCGIVWSLTLLLLCNFVILRRRFGILFSNPSRSKVMFRVCTRFMRKFSPIISLGSLCLSIIALLRTSGINCCSIDLFYL